MNKGYILVTDDGQVLRVDELTDSECQACDGLYSIINPTDMTEYYDGEWHAIVRAND